MTPGLKSPVDPTGTILAKESEELFTSTKQVLEDQLSSAVRKHLTKGFLCAVLDLSGILWPLLIPEYSGIKRRGMPFLGLRNPGISHYDDKYPLPFHEP